MSSKEIVLAIVPKITGFTSFCCSAYIVQHVVKDKKRRSFTYHRLLCGMSFSDCFGSFFGFTLSTWPFPRESGIWGASGTLQTCDAAGFFSHAGNLSTPLYSGSLATFYLLLLKYNWPDFRIKRIEPFLHAVPLTIGWSTAIAGAIMQLYGPANWNSWIAPYPIDCDSNPDIECVRGFDNYYIYRWAFMYVEVWATIVYVAVAMCMVYCSVRQLENKVDTHRFQADQEGRRKKNEKSKRVMHQALLYVGAFFLTWIFGTITRLIQLIQDELYFPLLVLMTIFFPCQGLFNALIYFKPCAAYFKKKKKKNKAKGGSGRRPGMTNTTSRRPSSTSKSPLSFLLKYGPSTRSTTAATGTGMVESNGDAATTAGAEGQEQSKDIEEEEKAAEKEEEALEEEDDNEDDEYEDFTPSCKFILST